MKIIKFLFQIFLVGVSFACPKYKINDGFREFCTSRHQVMLAKVEGIKTAGIFGDALAVNAAKAFGFISSREMPVIRVNSKCSFLN
ncbi:MAG: DUF808 family protein [Gillisia sp.]